jgi:multiple sugar transport system substrate-binding protein
MHSAGWGSSLIATGTGIAGILAARRAPAYAPGTSLHILLGKNFSPPADVENVRQGEAWAKQNKVTIKIEQIPINDLPSRAAAAIESKQGPDILHFVHNWQTQYADALVDVTDICTALEAKYGGYIDYCRAQAMLGGRFIGVPHTITPNVFVARKSYLKAAGTERWPRTWEEMRREGKKWKAAGRPIGQTMGHTYGDAVTFTYPYLWSFGAAERDDNGRVVIASKPTLEALKFLKAFWHDAMDPAGIGWDDASNNRAFLSGALSATSNGASIYLTAANQIVLDDKREPLTNDIDHVPNPAGPAGAFYYHITEQLAIPRYSRNAEVAKDFLRWRMEKEQLLKYLHRGQAYQASPLKAHLKDAMWDMFPALRPYRDGLLQGRHVGWRGPSDVAAARVVLNYTLVDMLSNVVTGKMSPEDSLKRAEGELKAIYAR